MGSRLLAAGFLSLAAIGLQVQLVSASLVWCQADPSFIATTMTGRPITLHLTIYGAGAVNAQAVASGGIQRLSESPSGKWKNVTVVAFTPNGPSGPFQVNYVISTGPFGSGTFLHQVSSHSGINQPMTFVLPYT